VARSYNLFWGVGERKRTLVDPASPIGPPLSIIHFRLFAPQV